MYASMACSYIKKVFSIILALSRQNAIAVTTMKEKVVKLYDVSTTVMHGLQTRALVQKDIVGHTVKTVRRSHVALY